MKLDSKYFDCLRAKPDRERAMRQAAPRCAKAGCAEPGLHPAPKGRGREGEFFHFCLDHVREYNRSYNYFNGMSDEDLAVFQEQGHTGHRPTWSMGARREEARARQAAFASWSEFIADPFHLFSGTEHGSRGFEPPARPIRNAERKSLRALNLDEHASAEEIKAAYKGLVKRHHPDANGGDRSTEDRLREIIQAYAYLKSVGFC
ncbi:MAG TPA: DnaJ domain-containing protein [Hyphomicrobiales bacterium]|nr:DnaJ domain-containing protein [Rhodobiaceae bacterium]HXK54267.1 DnaJ domain-containing protein [Hyphomicrobiales bacterium]